MISTSCMRSVTILCKSSHVIMRSSLYGISSTTWKRSLCNAGMKANTLNFMLTRLSVKYYSTPRARATRSPKSELVPSMESDAFYVVRKGDILGVYKSFSECQDQVGSSVCDPAASVYKGYSLRKETGEYLASHGLKNAIYSIHSMDIREDLFGTLVPCPLQQPDIKKTSTQERPKELSCILEFDGASKGNPGKAGAGVILRTEDGSVVSRLREGLGIATNNVAEYRAMILGMKYALKKGFKQIYVHGDSKLVCNQVQDRWRTRHQNLIPLCKEAKELKDKFLSFQIQHIKRELNSDADAEANLASNLPYGEVYEVPGGTE